MNGTPLIVAFVADLYFATRLESVAENLGFQTLFIEHADEISMAESYAKGGQIAEHLMIPGDAFLNRITREHPALIVFDLNNPAIPWREWITLIKTSPATRRLPVVCFGAHMNVASLAAAKASGADAVLARSAFVNSLDSIIQSYARRIDYTELRKACQEELSGVALHGLEEFNHGKYFEAHEILEEAWNQDQSVGTELYRAILQVAVAYYQIERGNYRGAIKMFLRLRQWIDPLPESCRGVDIARLRQDAQEVYEHLVALGEERIREFDRSLFKPVLFSRSSKGLV